MTLFVNRLTHIDASLWCPQRGLTGVSWQVDVELDGDLGEDGMLFDFGEVKPWLKRYLDAGVDHTLLVPTQASGVTFESSGQDVYLHATAPYDFEMRAPPEAVTALPWSTITPERLAEHLSLQLMRSPPARVNAIRLALHEEVIEGPAYGYSHGLKRHAGNCQRIAHGHRSRLHIWQNGVRVPMLESEWAAWLADRYLVDSADIIDAENPDQLASRYHAQQGEFFIRLPHQRCAVLAAPTTVENIAAWLARLITERTGQSTRVQAFEGIDKGAIAEAKS